MIDGVDKGAENKTRSKAAWWWWWWWWMDEVEGGGKKMTDDASPVAMIDSVERMAVSVTGQTAR